MPADRLVRILARLSDRGAGESEPDRLCRVSAEVCHMSGAGIMLMAGPVQQGTVCSSNEVSALIEELQFTLGEGPCVDACRSDCPVLEPDLASPSSPRWLAFTPAAVEAGARAAFGFPLHVGAVRLGALNLYRDEPGPLTDDEYADALVLAGVAARAVLAIQAHAPPGVLAAELEDGGNFRFVVHQASGMVAAQLGVSVGEALIRLRGFAFANTRKLDEVAGAVVDRHLRFSDEPPDRPPGASSGSG